MSRSTLADTSDSHDWSIYAEVKTQIWIAVSVYVLGAIVRKLLELKNSQTLQVLSVTLFKKAPIFTDISATGSKTIYSLLPIN